MRRYLVKTGVGVLFFLVFSIASSVAGEGAWQFNFPIPDDDPLWGRVENLWSNHWDEKNIEELIAALHNLEAEYPDKIAVSLWLSRAYYLKARYQDKKRTESFKKSEKYAARAVSFDKDNMTAMKLLIIAVSSYADMDYIKETYGPMFKDQLPVPVGPAVPNLDGIPEFKEALADWNKREDIEKGKKAVEVFRQIAEDNPENLLAQIWACRGDYYLGYYYLSIGDKETALPYFKEGDEYGKKALALSPNSVPANYWRQLNLARSIQHANIFVQARYLKPIMDHLVLTANENPTYFYCGPLISTATMIEKGGWLAEKGLGMAGYSLDTIIQGLRLAVMSYPHYFYTHFAKAEVLYHMDHKKEAKAVLQHILEMDPYQNPYHAPENLCVQRLAEDFLEKNFSEE